MSPYEYCYTRMLTTSVGVEQALQPLSPRGRGWELVSGAIVDGVAVVFWWKRPKRRYTVAENNEDHAS